MSQVISLEERMAAWKSFQANLTFDMDSDVKKFVPVVCCVHGDSHKVFILFSEDSPQFIETLCNMAPRLYLKGKVVAVELISSTSTTIAKCFIFPEGYASLKEKLVNGALKVPNWHYECQQISQAYWDMITD